METKDVIAELNAQVATMDAKVDRILAWIDNPYGLVWISCEGDSARQKV